MKKLIVIESDTDASQMIAFTFENDGFEVLQFDKEISVEEITRLKPHVVVIDYDINGTPGSEICSKLKQNEQTQNIPVIIYSATQHIDKISVNKCADGFMAKPLELEDLRYLVHRISLS